jgi:hypothetical protein
MSFISFSFSLVGAPSSNLSSEQVFRVALIFLMFQQIDTGQYISRVQMKSWAEKALETVNCCAFLKRSMLTVKLKFRGKMFFFFCNVLHQK